MILHVVLKMFQWRLLLVLDIDSLLPPLKQRSLALPDGASPRGWRLRQRYVVGYCSIVIFHLQAISSGLSRGGNLRGVIFALGL